MKAIFDVSSDIVRARYEPIDLARPCQVGDPKTTGNILITVQFSDDFVPSCTSRS